MCLVGVVEEEGLACWGFNTYEVIPLQAEEVLADDGTYTWCMSRPQLIPSSYASPRTDLCRPPPVVRMDCVAQHISSLAFNPKVSDLYA